MALTLSDVTQLLTVEGENQYGGEAVSQLQHALQCASLAEQAGETPHTITAALLHDIGHLLAKTSRIETTITSENSDDLHQYVALPFLRGLFSSAVLEPIRLHVDAKRYLCATDQSYWSTLSTASKHSLIVQGGVYTPPQAAEFAAQPFSQEAVRLRRYDDLAKLPEAVTPSLPHFLNIMHSVAI